ncbi:MAG: nucleotide exchange factor GrpE [Elusimicrobia bacterium HGW-Elusimicrobia-2]|nr:MAG: nucleotide exchange factor GrpE [Elusimicrobia bacterium HGW-Elusimicrobia-2]
MKDKHKAHGKEQEKPDTKTTEEEESSLICEAKEKIEDLKLLSLSLKQEKEKAENYYSQLISLKAEFDNYRKRLEKESAQMASYGKKSAIKEFLPVMDNVLRYEESLSEGEPADVEGLELIIKDLKKALVSSGVRQMDCMGKEFSPLIHEAVFKEKTNDFKNNTIIKIVGNGYYLGDEVIKPAMVAVAENMPEEESDDAGNTSNDSNDE